MYVNEWMPCIGKTGLQIFTTTSDQRYQLDTEQFLQTHFPMKMRQAEQGRVVRTVSENWLLAQLLEKDLSITGNRVFVLYGAAGSGKSELMRWLLTRIEQEHHEKATVTVRISRTDLDVVEIAERFHHQLSGNYFKAITHERWANLRQKPLTLAKLLVLSTLERLLGDDVIINALFYWLVEPVQRNLEQALVMMTSSDEEMVLELFSQEDWMTLCQQTELTESLDAEELRQQLVETFQQQMLEGVDLSYTLRLISDEIRQYHRMRPVLLVDDLVRSLNLFAGDLMDYFITLDSGNWDVVVGLTPASLQMHQRGRELVERIAFLDTIDDRVEKLWLSDDFGHDSYFLNEENCYQLISRYLQAYRSLNQCQCASCPARSRCEGLGQDDTGIFLSPFNRESLARLFRALPDGKGKVRYLLRSVRSILEALQDGESLLTVIRRYVHLESAARCTDEVLAAVVETYGPLVTDQRSIWLDSGLQKFFGREVAGPVAVEPLLQEHSAHVPMGDLNLQKSIPQHIDDPGKRAVREWLLAQPTNRQLLQPLRRGVGRFLRLLDRFDEIHREGIARPNGKLRFTQTYMNTAPPIVLEDLDDDLGISINRMVGNSAYDLYHYQNAKGAERRALEEHLLSDPNLVCTVYEAQTYQERSLQQLEQHLGMSVETLVLRLFLLHGCVHGVNTPIIPGLETIQLSTTPPQLPQVWQHLQSIFTDQDGSAIQALFDDYYQLRLNVYDGPKLRNQVMKISSERLLEPLRAIAVDNIPEQYRLGRRTLQAVLKSAQALTQELEHAKAETETKDPFAAVAVLSSAQWVRRSIRSQILEQLVQQLPPAQEMPEEAAALLVNLVEELREPQDMIVHKVVRMPDGRRLRIVAW